MAYFFDSFDLAISDILGVDVQEYCRVMDNLYKEDSKKWKLIIDGAKSGSVEELKESIKEFAICLERLKNL